MGLTSLTATPLVVNPFDDVKKPSVSRQADEQPAGFLEDEASQSQLMAVDSEIRGVQKSIPQKCNYGVIRVALSDPTIGKHGEETVLQLDFNKGILSAAIVNAVCRDGDCSTPKPTEEN